VKGTDRRRELVAWLEEQGNLSLPQIVKRFGVSKMTAHRDLVILESRQAIKRIHGGAIAAGRESRADAPMTNPVQTTPGACLVCRRPVGQHLLYSLTLTNGEQRHACCPHCGVSLHLALSDRVAMALTTDFLTGRPHPVQQTVFVLGSVVVPCCLPSMLTFEDEAMARRFQTGFGGRLGRLEIALDYLRGAMSLHQEGEGCPHCAAATGDRMV